MILTSCGKAGDCGWPAPSDKVNLLQTSPRSWAFRNHRASPNSPLSFLSQAPYVKVYLLDNGVCVAKKKTKVARKTLEPLYQQLLSFEESPQGKVLQVFAELFIPHLRKRFHGVRPCRQPPYLPRPFLVLTAERLGKLQSRGPCCKAVDTVVSFKVKYRLANPVPCDKSPWTTYGLHTSYSFPDTPLDSSSERQRSQ